MSNIRKLLFVSDAPHFGGAEHYVANMVQAAARRGIESSVCWMAPANAGSDVFAQARDAGARLHVVPAVDVRNSLVFGRRLRSLVRHSSPDAMIINASARPRFWGVPWIARLEHVPSVWVHHMVDHNDYRRLPPGHLGGLVEGLHMWRLPQALRHRLAACAGPAIVTLNERDRLQVAREQGIRPQRIRVIGNGIDTGKYRFDSSARACTRARWERDWTTGMPSDPERSSQPEPFVVGTAGRLVHGKGIEMLVQAAAILHRRNLPIRVVVAGEGSDRCRLESIVQKLGLTGVVMFLGHVDDMTGFYCGLDAFALCSSTESFGLVLAEAAACERAIVATPTAGARTQIDNGMNGLLLNSFSADELVDALARLQGEPALRCRLGTNARLRTLRDFSIDVALARTLSLLDRHEQPAPQAGRMSIGQAMEEAA